MYIYHKIYGMTLWKVTLLVPKRVCVNTKTWAKNADQLLQLSFKHTSVFNGVKVDRVSWVLPHPYHVQYIAIHRVKLLWMNMLCSHCCRKSTERKTQLHNFCRNSRVPSSKAACAHFVLNFSFVIHPRSFERRPTEILTKIELLSLTEIFIALFIVHTIKGETRDRCETRLL